MPIEVYGQAYRRRDARLRLIDLSSPVAFHMLKILLLPDRQEQNHWRNEVANWLHLADQQSSVKGGKRLRVDDLMDSIFAVTEISALEKKIINLIRDGYDLRAPQNIDMQSIQHRLVRMYKSLAKALSEGGDETIASWRTSLDSVLNRY